MNVIITWVLFIGLVAVISYSNWKERPTRAEPAHRIGKALSRNRVARVLASYTVLDWGLFLGAVCFLISAIVGTADALL